MAQSTGEKSAQMACSASYNRSAGWRTTRTYEGTIQGERADLTGQLISAGWEVSVDGIAAGGQVPPKWKITATASIDPVKENPEDTNQDAEQVLSDQWELGSNVVEKDLLQSDSLLMVQLFNVFGADVTQTSVGFAAAVEELKKFEADPSHNSSMLVTVDQSAVFRKLATLFAHGVKSIRIFQPTLRRTQIVTDKYSVRASQANCEKIITRDKMGDEGVPDTIKFNLPQAIDTDRRDAFSLLLKYGWQKKYPIVSQQSQSQWQLATEYEWGLWHTQLYKFA